MGHSSAVGHDRLAARSTEPLAGGQQCTAGLAETIDGHAGPSGSAPPQPGQSRSPGIATSMPGTSANPFIVDRSSLVRFADDPRYP
jgi:hypothetical protein